MKIVYFLFEHENGGFMLPIYICADQRRTLHQYQTILHNILLMEEYPAALQCVTCDPDDLLLQLRSDIQNRRLHNGLYILDHDSPRDLPLSISLSAQIRHLDARGFTAVITRDPSLPALAMNYHAEVSDVILLSDTETLGLRLHQDLVEALSRITKYQDSEPFTFVCDYHTLTIPSNAILYIAARNRRLHMVTLLHQYEFYGSLAGCARQLDDTFVYSHRACLVNTRLIVNIDSKRRILTFVNGEQCSGSVKGIQALMKANIIHSENHY